VWTGPEHDGILAFAYIYCFICDHCADYGRLIFGSPRSVRRAPVFGVGGCEEGWRPIMFPFSKTMSIRSISFRSPRQLFRTQRMGRFPRRLPPRVYLQGSTQHSQPISRDSAVFLACPPPTSRVSVIFLSAKEIRPKGSRL
jgi:hypothetical protein